MTRNHIVVIFNNQAKLLSMNHNVRPHKDNNMMNKTTRAMIKDIKDHMIDKTGDRISMMITSSTNNRTIINRTSLNNNPMTDREEMNTEIVDMRITDRTINMIINMNRIMTKTNTGESSLMIEDKEMFTTKKVKAINMEITITEAMIRDKMNMMGMITEITDKMINTN